MKKLLKNTDLLTTVIPLVGIVAEAIVTHFNAQEITIKDVIMWVTFTMMGVFTNKPSKGE